MNDLPGDSEVHKEDTSESPPSDDGTEPDDAGLNMVSVRREIEGVLEQIIPADAVPQEKREFAAQRLERMVLEQESYRGVLPHPRHFAEFDKILPGSAERILAMTEKEQSHRHSCEKDIIRSERDYSTRGQFLAAFLIFIPLAAAFYCAISGFTVAAGLFLAPPIISGAVAFLSGKLNFFSSSTADSDEDTQ